MKRLAINLAALVVITFGGAYLATEAGANMVAPGCCYKDCMDQCMGTGTFDYCHSTCNKDCSAC